MKICHIVPWFPSIHPNNLESRQGIFEYREVVKLNSIGHKFKIISIRWKGQPSHEILNSDIEIYRVPLLYSFPKIRYPIPNLFSLIKLIIRINSEWDPDLYVYGHMDYLTALPVFFLKNTVKKPTVVTIDGLTGINWFYGNKIVDTIGYIYSISIAKMIFKNADGIRFLSQELIGCISQLNISRDKVFVIPRGVDGELFKPMIDKRNLRAELNFKDNQILVLYVGRLDAVKGVDYLFKAAKKIISKNKNALFLIVGDGYLRKNYELSVREYADNILFMGYRDDIPKLMNIVDIFVLPSLSEGAANVILEASASGLPVVATNVGGIPRLIRDGETGILIKPKDANGLANAIRILIDNQSLAKDMGKAGRKYIEKNYMWDIICKDIINNYAVVVQKYIDSYKII